MNPLHVHRQPIESVPHAQQHVQGAIMNPLHVHRQPTDSVPHAQQHVVRTIMNQLHVHRQPIEYVRNVHRTTFGMEARVLHAPTVAQRQLVLLRHVHAQNGILEQRVPLQLQVRLQT